MLIKDIMTTPVVTIEPNALIEEALGKMLHHQVSGLPVVDENEMIVGLISEFDALALSSKPDSQFGPFAAVAHYMTEEVVTIRESQPIEDAVEFFLKYPMRRLPVAVDSRLLGIISRRDIVRALRDERAESQEKMTDAMLKKATQLEKG